MKAWLIEFNNAQGRTAFLGGRCGRISFGHAEDAIQFRSQREAQAILEQLPNWCSSSWGTPRVTEHEWPEPEKELVPPPSTECYMGGCQRDELKKMLAVSSEERAKDRAAFAREVGELRGQLAANVTVIRGLQEKLERSVAAHDDMVRQRDGVCLRLDNLLIALRELAK